LYPVYRKEDAMIELNDVYTTRTKPRKCPNCGSKKVADVHCGQLFVSDILREEINKGRAVLRTYYNDGPVPSWECRYCGMEMVKETDINAMTLF